MQDDDLIRSLQQLRPASSPRLSVLAVAFESGRRSAHGSVIRWRSISAFLLLLMACIFVPPGIAPSPASRGLLTLSLPGPPIVPSPENELHLRQAVLEFGLDAVPARPGSRIPSLSAHSLVFGGDL